MSSLDVRSGYFQLADWGLVRIPVTEVVTLIKKKKKISKDGITTDETKEENSDGTEFSVGDIEKLFAEARRNTKAKHEKWAKYYNKRSGDVRIKVNDWVHVKTHPLSSAAQKVVAKLEPKFEYPYRVLEVKHNNLVVWRAGKRLTVNVDQVRLYHQRKSDENEIRDGSSDSSFKSVRPISNESQYSRNNGPGERREVWEKGIDFKGNQSERHTSIASKRGPLITSSPSAWTEPSSVERKLWDTRGRSTLDLEDQRGNKERKRVKREETAVPGTRRYNLRPRVERVESRPSSEKRTHQTGRQIQRKKRATVQLLRRGTRKVMRPEYQKRKSPIAPGKERRSEQSLEVLVGDVSYQTQ
ncbi:uncharacterized protein TNCV_3871861 [Trichonephila clavipes]|nr:uncharacterized protein TNCV_3871861 [Trichonephila clavipes]